MGSLGKQLRETLKQLSRTTSVDQLKKSGVKQVQVVGLDRIASLIEEAVHRSLRSRLLGAERSRVADQTAEEFMRLLRNRDDLARLRDEAVAQKGRAEEEVDDLRRVLAEHRRELRERLAEGEAALRGQHEGEDAMIAQRVQEVFQELGERQGAGLPDLRDRVLELVMDLVGQQRASTIAALQAARDGEVDRLQRRIAKLSTSLAETEGRLAHVAQLKNVDPGISSVYREVQGLDFADHWHARKRELMAEIFRANLALQKGDQS